MGALVLLWVASAAHATPADVLAARVQCEESVCSFSVTVQHADEGWKHYANAWQVLTPAGKVLATRILRHPHVNEQPFTRSLRGVKVPAGITQVRIRARDSLTGYGGREVVVSLVPKGKGSGEPGR